MIYTQKRSSKILKGFSLERCKHNDHVRHDAIIGYQRNLHVSNEKPVPMSYVAWPEEKSSQRRERRLGFYLQGMDIYNNILNITLYGPSKLEHL
jgi:hypothetical protein